MQKRRLQKEYKSIKTNYPDFAVTLPTDSMEEWNIALKGPEGSLYEDEEFTLRFKFCSEYPIESPEVVFIGTPPIHKHIYSNGFICLSILYNEWSPALNVVSICLSIQSMLFSAIEKVSFCLKS